MKVIQKFQKLDYISTFSLQGHCPWMCHDDSNGRQSYYTWWQMKSKKKTVGTVPKCIRNIVEAEAQSILHDRSLTFLTLYIPAQPVPSFRSISWSHYLRLTNYQHINIYNSMYKVVELIHILHSTHPLSVHIKCKHQ